MEGAKMAFTRCEARVMRHGEPESELALAS
jgi:hypothetical protein